MNAVALEARRSHRDNGSRPRQHNSANIVTEARRIKVIIFIIIKKDGLYSYSTDNSRSVSFATPRNMHGQSGVGVEEPSKQLNLLPTSRLRSLLGLTTK